LLDAGPEVPSKTVSLVAFNLYGVDECTDITVHYDIHDAGDHVDALLANRGALVKKDPRRGTVVLKTSCAVALSRLTVLAVCAPLPIRHDEDGTTVTLRSSFYSPDTVAAREDDCISLAPGRWTAVAADSPEMRRAKTASARAFAVETRKSLLAPQ
jgi:hypothetical protein